MMVRPDISRYQTGGFSLVLTLLVLAAVTIIVVGLFSSTVSEKFSSVSYENVERSEFALQAGLNRASSMLTALTQTDEYLVMEQPTGEDARQHLRTRLIGATPVQDGWAYTPLFSGYEPPPDTVAPTLNFGPLAAKPVRNGQPPEDATESIRVLPWQAQPHVGWEEFYHSDDHLDAATGETPRISARYAFWVEDLQGRLNLQTAGNNDAVLMNALRHTRMPITNAGAHAHVPGYNLTYPNLPLLNQSALYTLIKPQASGDDISLQMDNWLIDSREALITPEIWKQVVLSKGFNPPSLIRDSSGVFPEDEFYGHAANMLEANTTTGIYGYTEQAKIPRFTGGFAHAGNLKMNLNKVLREIASGAISPDAGVHQIAGHIRKCLPQFEQRAGGYPFPEGSSLEERRFAYLKALAASIIDYADEDDQPTMLEGQYRGMDSFPLVNEYFIKQQVHELSNERVHWSITTYAELWNMTNQTISGNVQGGFEFLNEVKIAQDEYVPSAPSAEPNSGYLYMMDPKPEEVDGRFWHAPVENITLAPNQYKVVKLGEVHFAYPLNLGPDAIGPSQIEIAANHFSNRYRLKFKATGEASYRLVDQPRGTLESRAVNLALEPSPSAPDEEPTPIAWQSTAVAAAYGPNTETHANVGDPRASFYLGTSGEAAGEMPAYLAANDYVGGASPGGRNRRHDLFDLAAPETTEGGAEFVHAETRPSLWPDGGHESAYGSHVNDIATDPDTIAGVTPESPPKFLQVISNAGRYYSVSELGNIFDPHMWSPAGYDSTFNTLSLFHDLEPGTAATASAYYCGGNTLRVGRPEHRRWRPDFRQSPNPDRPMNRGLTASALLDVFHAGIPRSSSPEDITGDLAEILPGCININTATKDTLRALVAGKVVMDANTQPATVHPPHEQAQADVVAQAIIDNRPYLSPAEAADRVQRPSGKKPSDHLIFGNSEYYTSIDGTPLGAENRGINDPGLEEFFARLYNNSTVRSRNFRIYVTAQVLRHPPDREPVVEATRARLYHVFVRPLRDAQGNIIRQQVQITYARNL